MTMATMPRDSKVLEKTEALDDECLRALGHPHDHAIRQELLSALEWDDSLRPAHVGSVLRDQLAQVQPRSADLSDGTPLGTSGPAAAAPSLYHGVQSLCRGLAARLQVLTACRSKRRPD
jgi:hypothetical protein